jgi:general secretion pathway protein N
MFVPSAGTTVQQGAVLVLAAALAAFGQILSLALVRAAPAQAASPPALIDPAATVVDATGAPTKRNAPVASDLVQHGNPLWSLSLSSLSVTRERPIFSPSRRPPSRPVVAAPQVPPAKPPQLSSKPPVPDHPLLTLLGTLAGDNQGVGIFLNEADKTTLRLRIGEDHEGWVLRSIRGGEVTFEKDERTATLGMAPLGSAAQTTAFQMALGNTWRDGDGQMIHAPPRREPKSAPPMAAPSRNTWLDGDGQVISPPSQSPPSIPTVSPTTVDPVL